MVLSALCVVVLTGAPMADVWPFQARRLPDGAVEYGYDLTALKASSGFTEAKATHGDEAVKKFLAGLPRQVTVKLPPGVTLSLSGGQGLELAPLATSFALTPDGPLATDNPLGRKAGARLLAPLDPRTPKVLPGAELPLWLARDLELQALAAIELDTEWMRRELWSKVTERALARARSSTGDTREGAFALAARVAASSACGDVSRLPPALKGDSELKTAVEAELQRFRSDGDGLVPPAPWAWSPELGCAWLRTRMLARPLEQSRAGTAAVLVFFELLDKDPKLKALWERTRQRRDRFVGAPGDEPILAWRAATKGDVARALEVLSEFIDALPLNGRAPPPLIAGPSTPFTKFISELSGAERSAAMDELSAAVGDGRVQPSGDGWPQRREAALAPLLSETSKLVQIDSSWRDRLGGAFAALQGSHREARRGGLDAEDEQLERTELALRLNVPPALEVEPTGLAFERSARSLEALASALTAESLAGLKGLGPDGRRAGEPLVSTARRLVPLLDGLSQLAQPGVPTEGKQVAEARRFVATWRSDPGLSRDVRATFAAWWAVGSERSHAAIAGVSRRELRVAFANPPTVSLQGEAKGFVLNTAVEQRYLVPVLVTLGATAPHTLPSADRTSFRTAVDAAGRDLAKLEGALQETLHASGTPGVNGN